MKYLNLIVIKWWGVRDGCFMTLTPRKLIIIDLSLLRTLEYMTKFAQLALVVVENKFTYDF